MRFVYTAWFQDLRLPPDDQDHEWVACFVVEAIDEATARAWGDHLSQRRAISAQEPFLSSQTESVELSNLRGIDSLPVVTAGDDATDEEIGW